MSASPRERPPTTTATTTTMATATRAAPTASDDSSRPPPAQERRRYNSASRYSSTTTSSLHRTRPRSAVARELARHDAARHRDGARETPRVSRALARLVVPRLFRTFVSSAYARDGALPSAPLQSSAGMCARRAVRPRVEGGFVPRGLPSSSRSRPPRAQTVRPPRARRRGGPLPPLRCMRLVPPARFRRWLAVGPIVQVAALSPVRAFIHSYLPVSARATIDYRGVGCTLRSGLRWRFVRAGWVWAVGDEHRTDTMVRRTPPPSTCCVVVMNFTQPRPTPCQ